MGLTADNLVDVLITCSGGEVDGLATDRETAKLAEIVVLLRHAQPTFAPTVLSAWQAEGRELSPAMLLELDAARARVDHYRSVDASLASKVPGLTAVNGLEINDLYPGGLARHMNDLDYVASAESDLWQATDYLMLNGWELHTATFSYFGGSVQVMVSLRRPNEDLYQLPYGVELTTYYSPGNYGAIRPLVRLEPEWRVPAVKNILMLLYERYEQRFRARDLVDAVLLHGALPGPMTCGVLHPSVVLPLDAQTWEAEDLNRAIVHELEHVRRGDWVSHCLARALCAVYWFHPLVWIAWRQLALEAERSCDDAVLGRSEATAYADQLVSLAQQLSLAKMPAKSPLLAMANRADLAARVGAVLDTRRRRGRAGALPVALACAAAAVLVLTMSPLRMVAAPQSAATAPMPRFSANTMLVIVNVTVSDKSGKSLEGLSANDFVLTEEGVPQTIRVFEFQGAQDSVSSYYILGYYTTNLNVDGQFRKIAVTGKADTMAKLNYRAGYYGKSLGAAGVVIGDGGGDRSLSPDITPPVVIYKKEPEYSEEARKAKYQGTVVLYVDLDASGQVTKVTVNRSLGLGLDQKAVEAVSQWQFKPGMQAGKPVAMRAQVEVSFRLL